jgi:hypothetical protein
LIDVATAEAPKRGRKPKKLTVEPPAPPPSVDEDPFAFADSTPESPLSPRESPETAPWPDFGVWKAGGLKSEQKVSPTSGFNYWNHTLNAAQRIFGTWYAYRLWPVMKLQPRGNKFVNPNCAKFSAEDGPLSTDLIYGQLRIGFYLLRLLQRQTSPSGQVFMCEVEIKGSGNFNEDEMPILDVEQVDWEHPSNAEYAKICRSRGILKAPEEPQQTTEGAEEMAATSVLGEIASKAFDKMGQQQGPQQQQSDVSGGVGTELVGLLREQINVNRPPAQQGTVKDQLEGLVTLAKTMTPAPAPAADMGPYIELQRENNSLVRELMRKDVERAEAEANRAKEEAAQYRAALPQPKTVDEQWDELERAAKRFDRMTGKKQRDEEDAEEDKQPSTAAGFWGGLLGALPAIMKSGVELLREGNVMLYNYKLNGTGAVPLNPATGQPGTEPLAPNADEEPDDANLSPEDRARMEHMQNVANQLTALASPMLNHVMRNRTGGDFAQFVIENYGQQSFDLIRSTPKETILAMIQNYPPVWSQIAPQRVLQFQKFLDEFMGYSAVPVQ